MSEQRKDVRIHPTAMIEDDVKIGRGTSVWDNAHIRHHAVIGEQCIIGGKSLIAYEVEIGNRCKINSGAYVCYGVKLEDGVMISAGVIFTNDRFPRAATPDLSQLRNSEPDQETCTTLVREGATVGAACTIGSDLVIGRFAMVGMGSVVTKSVPDFHLMLGNPARSVGVVCRCGQRMMRFAESQPNTQVLHCSVCDRKYYCVDRQVTELDSSDQPTV